jgi:hypothetical protein
MDGNPFFLFTHPKICQHILTPFHFPSKVGAENESEPWQNALKEEWRKKMEESGEFWEEWEKKLETKLAFSQPPSALPAAL